MTPFFNHRLRYVSSPPYPPYQMDAVASETELNKSLATAMSSFAAVVSLKRGVLISRVKNRCRDALARPMRADTKGVLTGDTTTEILGWSKHLNEDVSTIIQDVIGKDLPNEKSSL